MINMLIMVRCVQMSHSQSYFHPTAVQNAAAQITQTYQALSTLGHRALRALTGLARDRHGILHRKCQFSRHFCLPWPFGITRSSISHNASTETSAWDKISGIGGMIVHGIVVHAIIGEVSYGFRGQCGC